MANYLISDNTTLRDVYLMWLIALDPQDFLRQNNLDWREAAAFRNHPTVTYGVYRREKEGDRG